MVEEIERADTFSDRWVVETDCRDETRTCQWYVLLE